MRDDIMMLAVPEQPVISIRGRTTQEDLPAFIGRSFGDIYAHLGLLGVIGNGRPFVIYHGFSSGQIEAEVCVPVSREVSATGRIQTRILPACTVARTVHVGPYDDIGLAYAALNDWIDERRCSVAGAYRERYLVGIDDGVAPAGYRTEIDVPVTEARVPVSA
jgi:effector-binding domain-containing protein